MEADQSRSLGYIYHGTNHEAAYKIISSGYMLPAFVKNEAEEKINKGYHYFISFARSVFSHYLKDIEAIITFDHEILRQNNKFISVDYWSHFRKSRELKSEMEDRLITNKDRIYVKKAIVKVDLIIDTVVRHFPFTKKIILHCKVNKIPIKIYKTRRDFINKNPMNIIDGYKHIKDKIKTYNVSIPSRRYDDDDEEKWIKIYYNVIRGKIDYDLRYSNYKHLKEELVQDIKSRIKKIDSKLSKLIIKHGGVERFVDFLYKKNIENIKN